MTLGSENLLSLMGDPVLTPDYPTFELRRDESGELVRDADLKFIPDWSKNSKYRAHTRFQCETDLAYRDAQILFCRSNILYFINVWCFTYDPRLANPHIPFVTFPFQDDVITWCLWLLKHHETGLIEKSRDMGATWMMEAVAAYLVLFFPAMVDYQMSLREDDVDNRQEDSLLGKLRYLLRNLPDWMRFGWEENQNGVDNKMSIKIPQNGGLVRGQLTMGTSGRSGRSSRVFNDEFAFVEDAERVLKALAALSPSGLYLSTPNGMGNAFYVMAHSPGVRKKTLHWRLHSLKNPEWAAKERAKITYTDETWAQEHEISYEMSTQGRVYPEFISFSASDYEWCHVQNGSFYEFDPHYDVFVFLDFGMADPTSAVFAQIKPAPQHFEGLCSEVLVIFDEEEAGSRTVDKWAEVFQAKDYPYREFVGDYRSGNQRDPTGQTWITYLGKHGINVVGRYNTEQAPIMEVKRLLEGGRMQGGELRPLLAIHRSCVNTIKSFQNWSYPTEKDPEGKTIVKAGGKPLHNQWSHSMKAVCYGVDWLYGQNRVNQVPTGDWNFRVFGERGHL